MCACANKGEKFRDRTRGRIIWFLREPKTCCAQGFESAYMWWELHWWGGNAFQGEFLLCLAPGFLVTSAWLCRALPLSLRSHVCVWLIASSRCTCIRESIFAWSIDLFLILSSFCHLFKFFIFFVLLGFCFSLSLFLVRLWCVDNALIKGEIEECGVLTPGCDEWIVNRVVWSCAWSLVTGTRASSVNGEYMYSLMQILCNFSSALEAIHTPISSSSLDLQFLLCYHLDRFSKTRAMARRNRSKAKTWLLKDRGNARRSHARSRGKTRKN